MIKKFIFSVFILCCFNSLRAINPLTSYKFKPENIKLKYEEYKVGTADGACMNAWYLPSQAKNKRNTCVLIVGSDSGNMGFSLSYVTGLLADGFDVVTFDYRGFGESSPFKHNPKKLYHKEYIEDFVSILSWVKREFKHQKVACMAFSMGSMISTLGKEQESFDYLISEGFITSPKKVTDRIKAEKKTSIFLPLLKTSYETAINKYDIPILIFASSTEKITTLEDAKTFAAKAKNRKIIAHGGGHLAGARTLGGKEYIGLVTDFLLNN